MMSDPNSEPNSNPVPDSDRLPPGVCDELSEPRHPEVLNAALESESAIVKTSIPVDAGVNFVRLLYNHNPFYLISACLFVYGLKRMFRVGDSSVLFDRGMVGYMEPWWLMVSLAAVTLLMAVTAVLVVRVGRIWEDARSIVMVVLLMFLAISVSFDELLNVKSDRDNGGTATSVMMLMGISVCFSIGLAEILIRGLLLRLAWAWRTPLYLFLLLFFSYPVLLLPEVLPVSKVQIQWLISAFPLVASAITLTLIPAIRQGSQSVADNGTPWSWPMFPWSPFVMIACAVVFRSYSLTISFDVPTAGSHFWDSTFGLYLLVPFLLAVLVLLLEIGVTEKLAGLKRSVLCVAPLLLVVAHPQLVPWCRLPSYAAFLDQLTYSVASPVYLTLIGLLLLFTWAMWRGIASAEVGVVMGLIALAVLPVRFAVDQAAVIGFRAEQIWPVVVLSIMQAVNCVRRKSSFAAILCAASIMIVLSLTTNRSGLGGWSSFLAIHAVLATAIFVGSVFRDDLAEFFREVSPFMLPLTTLVGGIMLFNRSVQPGFIAVYPILMTALALALALILKNPTWLFVFKLHCIIASGIGVVCGFIAFIMMKLPDGAKPVVLAVISFIAAILVSALKSGFGGWLKNRWKRLESTSEL